MKVFGWILIVAVTIWGVNFIWENGKKDYSFDSGWGIAKDNPLR